MHIVSRLKLSYSTKKRKLLFNLPIAQRLTLGFLLAALIAGLLAGGTALMRIQSLHRQSDFYQQLLQTKTTLASANDLLELMNIQMHEILTLANDTPFSMETLQDNENQLRNLIDHYDGLLNGYIQHDLLKDRPEQVSLLREAQQDTLLTTQAALASSAQRTWKFFHQAQIEILQDIKPGDDNTNALNQERLQGEPSFSDAQSAIVALIRFNDRVSNSARDAVSTEESNQIMITVVGIILAIVSIALIGLFISNTVVHRLKQLRQITKAIEQGEVKDRIHVVGSDEIADISTSVNTMLEIIASEQEIKVASELKDQFIAGISHELRNPLTNVFGWLEILIDYHEELDGETQMRFLGRAMYGCQELIQIVNSVLDATRVGRGMGTAQLTAVSLNSLVQSVLDNMNPHVTENYHIKTVMEKEFVALADPQYVRQIVQNLLSNAFKYSPKQSTVTVSIHRSSHQSADSSSAETNDLSICVKDTGLGIPPEEIPQLFQKFARLQRDHSVRGTGLGLYLCKQLVESMGGRIWVESTGIVGEGSSFFFTLQQPSPIVDIPRPSYIQTQKVPV
jgi:signal transduction histidine kinase